MSIFLLLSWWQGLECALVMMRAFVVVASTIRAFLVPLKDKDLFLLPALSTIRAHILMCQASCLLASLWWGLNCLVIIRSWIALLWQASWVSMTHKCLDACIDLHLQDDKWRTCSSCPVHSHNMTTDGELNPVAHVPSVPAISSHRGFLGLGRLLAPTLDLSHWNCFCKYPRSCLGSTSCSILN